MWAAATAAPTCWYCQAQGFPDTKSRGFPNKGKVALKIRCKKIGTSAQVEQYTQGKQQNLLPNALRRKIDPSWREGGNFSLGVDLGGSRTGLALGRGLLLPRPLSVLNLKGQKLELRLLDIAQEKEVDEFIVGLPLSHDGKETPMSNKVRSIVGRLAVQAAQRGLRVYLQDEHGTTEEALDCMIEIGVRKLARRDKIDAYSAVMILERYFNTHGSRAEPVLPKQLDLLEKLQKGSCHDEDFSASDDEDFFTMFES